MLSITLSGSGENWQSSSIHKDIIDIFRFMFIIRYPYSHLYYLIYLTLHWPFLINLRHCSLFINSYEYIRHTTWACLFNSLFIGLLYGKVAQWLKFCAVTHAIMGSNLAETVYTFWRIFLFFIVFFCIFSVFITSIQCIRLFIITTMHVQHK